MTASGEGMLGVQGLRKKGTGPIDMDSSVVVIAGGTGWKVAE